MANVEAGSPRLYAHALITWAVSLLALRLLYRFNQEAVRWVGGGLHFHHSCQAFPYLPPLPCTPTCLPPSPRLRIAFLLNRPPGAESHTVLVTDIPGPAYGTIPHRTDSTLLRFLPRREFRWCGRVSGHQMQILHPSCACGPAGIKAWLAGAATTTLTSVGSQIKLGASWVAGAAGKVAGRRGPDQEGSAPGDFSIAAGRQQSHEEDVPAAVRVTQDAWQQVRACGRVPGNRLTPLSAGLPAAPCLGFSGAAA